MLSKWEMYVFCDDRMPWIKIPDFLKYFPSMNKRQVLKRPLNICLELIKWVTSNV